MVERPFFPIRRNLLCLRVFLTYDVSIPFHIYIYIYTRPTRARPIRAQGAHKGPAHTSPGVPIRAQPIRAQGGP